LDAYWREASSVYWDFMRPRPLIAAVGLPMTMVMAACDAAAVAPTPTTVPGAAATAARAAATPIPTPIQSPSPSPLPSRPSPVSSPASSPAASPSPNAVGQAVLSEQSVAETRQALDRALSAPDLAGIETLLAERVSLSGEAGGADLDRESAASWLRERAAPGIRVAQLQPYPDLALLEVVTEGWPAVEPVSAGRIAFRLHLYDESGRQNEERGRWKIDVIVAE
jgi:hypothetical protein